MGKNGKQQRQEQMREMQERLRREEAAKKKKEQQVFLWAMIGVFALAVIVAAVVIAGAIGNRKPAVPTTPTTEAATLMYPNAPKMEDLDFSSVSDFSRFEITEEETDYVLINVSYKDNNGLQRTGDIVVRLFDEVAPITVDNFKGLVKQHFYDGLVFHRIIENFMVQGGGFDVDGKEKETAKAIVGEFATNGYNNHLSHVRGVISMARTNVMNSASSQFYIVQKDSPHLNTKYAGFGFTVYGMDTVDAIAVQPTDSNDKPIQPVVINFARFVKLNPAEEATT
jgi:peptidyl-prolyl cis-trans isomerase B (cyclophilin B)